MTLALGNAMSAIRSSPVGETTAVTQAMIRYMYTYTVMMTLLSRTCMWAAKTKRTEFISQLNSTQVYWNTVAGWLKPCPHCRRNVRQSQKTTRQRRQSHLFC